MVPRLFKSGQSFRGVARYLSHDPHAKTSERVAWTHTLNCANDNLSGAVNEMLWTYRDADILKEEAAIHAGGSRVTKPVKHLSLNWARGETPDHKHMIETARDYLRHMNWDEHQAFLIAHTDKEHPHVHIVINRIHPENGTVLDDRFEKRRTSKWALNYEREAGKIWCEQRLKAAAEREPSPPREAWLQLKQSEKDHADAERCGYDPGYLGKADNATVIKSEEWRILHHQLRAERLAYVADGKAQFNEMRTAVYRKVRQEFREAWSDFYAARRGGMDSDALAEIRDGILTAQRERLEECRTLAGDALRADRAVQYRQLLDEHIERRAELTNRQQQKLTSPHLLDLVNREPAPQTSSPLPEFSRAATLITSREALEDHSGATADEHETSREEFPTSEISGVRGALDIASGISGGVLGGASAIVESLFDGFFGRNPNPQQKAERQPIRPKEPEFPPHNPLAAFAELARRTIERQREHDDREWWDERRGRFRD